MAKKIVKKIIKKSVEKEPEEVEEEVEVEEQEDIIVKEPEPKKVERVVPAPKFVKRRMWCS